MTREQIERASVTMKESQNYHMSFEDAQDYISKCGFDIPWNDGDVFVDEREITRTVGNVLKWRINSVWHDASEEPEQEDEPILVEYEDWGFECSDYTVCDDIWDYRTRLKRDGACCTILRWAYIKDLIPERKEETK